MDNKIVNEKPIIFNSEMIRAILEGRKTQTRRPIKFDNLFDGEMLQELPGIFLAKCLFGKVGDRLWVRESFFIDVDLSLNDVKIMVDSGCNLHGPFYDSGFEDNKTLKKISSIHMPRWASRITLEIIDVRAERVQDITEEDAMNEGIISNVERFNLIRNTRILNKYRYAFINLWDSIYAHKYPWKSNPWVWAITFKVMKV